MSTTRPRPDLVEEVHVAARKRLATIAAVLLSLLIVAFGVIADLTGFFL